MAGPGLSKPHIEELLGPYYPDPPDALLQNLAIYLELLLRWNVRTNLTAIRSPEQIVTRHFGESLFVARHLPQCQTVLDLGSGAGFPGIPIQLALPHLAVTLGEVQNKKASFLREVVRSLELPTEVWSRRVEEMPAECLFDVVAMRAVDNPQAALLLARQRVKVGGTLALLTTEPAPGGLVYQLPNAERQVLQMYT